MKRQPWRVEWYTWVVTFVALTAVCVLAWEPGAKFDWRGDVIDFLLGCWALLVGFSFGRYIGRTRRK